MKYRWVIIQKDILNSTLSSLPEAFCIICWPLGVLENVRWLKCFFFPHQFFFFSIFQHSFFSKPSYAWILGDTRLIYMAGNRPLNLLQLLSLRKKFPGKVDKQIFPRQGHPCLEINQPFSPLSISVRWHHPGLEGIHKSDSSNHWS